MQPVSRITRSVFGFRVTDKTAAKAIRWFLARSDGAS